MEDPKSVRDNSAFFQVDQRMSLNMKGEKDNLNGFPAMIQLCYNSKHFKRNLRDHFREGVRK